MHFKQSCSLAELKISCALSDRAVGQHGKLQHGLPLLSPSYHHSCFNVFNKGNSYVQFPTHASSSSISTVGSLSKHFYNMIIIIMKKDDDTARSTITINYIYRSGS